MGKPFKPLPEERIGMLMVERGWSLALAESCTGGLIGYRLTAVAGSSRYFRGGVIAYDNSVKERSLEVPPATLAEYGAVSRQTALAMARGAKRLFKVDIALSVTGIAGPAGGTEEKPVGLVFAAVAAGRRTAWRKGLLKGGRKGIRRDAAEMALNLLLSVLEEDGERR